MAAQPNAWICCVCGHIHIGDEQPECCVLCGAGSDVFEPHQEETAPEMPTVTAQWRCLICDYVADGDQPPEVCPVCGAPADQFESHLAEAAEASAEQATQTYVIVGAGIAGISAAEAIRKTSSSAEIIVLSKETELPYYRLNRG